MEVEKYANKSLAKTIFADEVICVRSFGNELIAHSAQKPNISQLFEELLVTKDNNHEIYFDTNPFKNEIESQKYF